MRTTLGRLSVTGVAFLLGLLLVVQFRAQNAAGGLSSLSTQDLTTLVANLNDRNGQLRAQVAQLEGQLAQLQAQQRNGESNVGDLQTELDRIRLWAGLDPAEGSGISLSISGPVTPDAVNDILNELRLAGAEALAVADTRVVASTALGGTAGHLTLDGRAAATPLRIVAIGDPANLQAILSRPGGVIGRIQVALPDVNVLVNQAAGTLEVPATAHDLVPADGRPHL